MRWTIDTDGRKLLEANRGNSYMMIKMGEMLVWYMDGVHRTRK